MVEISNRSSGISTCQNSIAVRLIIKFPQWYDRFHLFGYDPPRMAEAFDKVWVGTEVRNPLTRRGGLNQMDFVLGRHTKPALSSSWK